MAKHEFSTLVTIKGGRMDLPDREGLRAAVACMPDGDACLTIGPPKRGKTHDQLAYWFAVPVPLIAEHCGYTERQMHYALLGECFGYSPGPMGTPIPNKPSIADCTVEEVTHLIEWVLTWAPTELGVIVPEPDKDWRSKRRGRAA
jgi:hypothetical protein